MNRRAFLRGAAAAPVAVAAAMLLPREPEPPPWRATVDGKPVMKGITIDLQAVMPQDGEWHETHVDTRAKAYPPAKSVTVAEVDYLTVSANRW